MKTLKYPATHGWHVSINKYASEDDFQNMRFMYNAKSMAFEVPRIANLFTAEREQKLPQKHKQCSISPEQEIENNHLTCCLGTKCSECHYLQALDGTERSTDEEIDLMKAWTCAAHIVSRGGDPANEGFILTKGDRMYWDNVYKSLAASEPNYDEE